MSHKIEKIEQYLVHPDGTEEFLDASDASPSCNRRGAQYSANRERLPVVAYAVISDHHKDFRYRVEPEELPES